MGEEIRSSKFSNDDFERFRRRLDHETECLRDLFSEGEVAEEKPVAGFELEAWLIDRQGQPVAKNEAFLESLDNEDVVSELAQFNVEINAAPEKLTGHALSGLHTSMQETWRQCDQTARNLGIELVATGILPTIADHHLSLQYMSPRERYRALNDEVLKRRGERPIKLNIEGADTLKCENQSIMLESAATSFQIHMQVRATMAGRYYNASKIASAPLMAVSGNSPYLFGKQLWEETRIPLFEQAVDVGGAELTNRVSFGHKYVDKDIFEVFEANKDYPILLPVLFDKNDQSLHHLRFHNGTIWRWNRPLLGFDEKGHAHVRIEHRIIPAGPSHLDEFANAAFYYGLVQSLVNMETPAESLIGFDSCKHNFYTAAKLGLNASTKWIDGCNHSVRRLCLEYLIPQAIEGLLMLGIDREEANSYLDVIRQRILTGQTGSVWQKTWVKQYGKDWDNLVLDYADHQRGGKPVHEWLV